MHTSYTIPTRYKLMQPETKDTWCCYCHFHLVISRIKMRLRQMFKSHQSIKQDENSVTIFWNLWFFHESDTRSIDVNVIESRAIIPRHLDRRQVHREPRAYNHRLGTIYRAPTFNSFSASQKLSFKTAIFSMAWWLQVNHNPNRQLTEVGYLVAVLAPPYYLRWQV